MLNSTYFKIYAKTLNVPLIGRSIINYGDNYGSHSNADCKLILERKNVQLRSLIPGSTHIMQPVDQGIGKVFAQYIYSMFPFYICICSF